MARRFWVVFILSLSTQLQSGQGASQEVCYPDAGCFSQSYPWVGPNRPFPPPQGPDVIKLRLYLYTRRAPTRFTTVPTGALSLNGSDFHPKRRTSFIVHGFITDGNATWLAAVKDSYLKAMDANVFLVDWGSGAKNPNYLQVSANTRVAGALLGRFMVKLMQEGLDAGNVHLVGHSLGSHVSAYAAQHVLKVTGTRVGVLTGLDPAQPGFEGEIATEVRFSKEDAEFVEAIHTDAKPFIPLFGFGFMQPIGDVDFYVNNGMDQPGCNVTLPKLNIKAIDQLGSISLYVLMSLVGCPHGRVVLLYQSAIDPSTNCTFTGRRAITPFPIITSRPQCGQNDCLPMDLFTYKAKKSGQFQVITSGQHPYCPKGKKSQVPSTNEDHQNND